MSNDTCIESECSAAVFSRMMCSKHYQRWYKENRREVVEGDPRGRRPLPDSGDGSCIESSCGRTAKSRGLCHRHYERRRLHGLPMPVVEPRSRTRVEPVRESEISKAWKAREHSKVMNLLLANTVAGPGSCLEWQGRRDRGGYGILSVMASEGRRSTQYAHRLMLQASQGGNELAGLHTHHACTNRACINPEHLQPVTVQQNNGEMHARISLNQRIAILEAELRRVDPHNRLIRHLIAVENV